MAYHELSFPPHADGFYISSALCACGHFQWDADNADALTAARDEVIADWQIHVEGENEMDRYDLDHHPLVEAVLLAVEEVDNSWNDEGTHVEYHEELAEALINLRRVYGRLTDHEMGLKVEPDPEPVLAPDMEAFIAEQRAYNE